MRSKHSIVIPSVVESLVLVRVSPLPLPTSNLPHVLTNSHSTLAEFTLPSLMLTVSGVVTHHTPGSITTLGDTGAPKSALGNKKRRANELSHLPLDSLPRAFSQNFVLVPQPNTPGGVNVNVSLTPATIPETQPTVPGENGLPAPPPTLVLAAQVFVQADSFRFVG